MNDKFNTLSTPRPTTLIQRQREAEQQEQQAQIKEAVKVVKQPRSNELTTKGTHYNILFTEEQTQVLKGLASLQNKGITEIVRNAVQQYIDSLPNGTKEKALATTKAFEEIIKQNNL